MLRALTLSLRLVDVLLAWFISVLVAFLVLIVTSQLVDRHLIDIPLAAPDQFVRVGLIWLTFVGFAAAIRARENIRIDFVDRLLGPRVRAVVDTLFDIVLLVLLGVLITKGWRVVEAGQMQILLGTPLTAAVPAAGFVAGSALMALFIALRLIARLIGTSLPGDEQDQHFKQDPV
jgi:TRAP-type C4-dicarboxylate transport system permease small subunit